MTDGWQSVADQLGWAMQRYQRSTQAFDDVVARRLGLRPVDLRCLDWLADGPKNAGELSAAVGLRPAATTALIDRLAKRGLVRRSPSERDRRQVVVELTEEGQARAGEAYGPLVREGAELLAGYSEAELAGLRDLVDRMRELTERHRDRLTEGD